MFPKNIVVQITIIMQSMIPLYEKTKVNTFDQKYSQILVTEITLLICTVQFSDVCN